MIKKELTINDESYAIHEYDAESKRIFKQIMNNSNIMQNPMAKNAIEMYKNGNTKDLQNLAENLCKERGVTPQQMQEMIKKQFGM